MQKRLKNTSSENNDLRPFWDHPHFFNGRLAVGLVLTAFGGE